MTFDVAGQVSGVADEVVRFLTTQQALTELGELAGLLTVQEARRNSALHRSEDRLDHLAAHLLVRECVARLTGTDVAGVVLRQRCSGCGEEGHGAPTVELSGRRTLRHVHVSLSRGGGVVAAAASFHPVGVDVEPVDRHDGRPVGLTAAERTWLDGQDDARRAFLRLWTRKEALVKVGAFDLEAAPSHVVLDDVGPAACWRGWRLREWNALPGALGAWAVADPEAAPAS